jgi:hypothetical protein
MTARYTKVRLDPRTLTILTTDTTYATWSASTNTSCMATTAGCPGYPAFAAAASCNGNFDASGRGNVDLTGMPFHVAGTGTDVSMFKTYESFDPKYGFTSSGTATIDAARKVVTLTGGGDCGGFGALGGLPLEQD